MRLKGKVALITGAGSGIGEACARLFAKEGARVAVNDVSEEDAARVAGEIAASGGDAMSITADVSRKEQVETMVDTIVEKMGRLDILINNAGIARDALLLKMSEEQWDKVMDVNLKGSFLCSQAAASHMVEQGSGKIVLTASVGMLGNVGQANYVASKCGIVGLTRTLALELARYGINVNCVSPGATKTRMTSAIPPDIAERFRKMIPFRRFAEPGEIAAVHLFLVSDEAGYITGQVIFVDGGLSVGL